MKTKKRILRHIYFYTLAILCSALFVSCDKDKNIPVPPAREKVDVHIIMGQSNGLGWAPIYLLPKDLRDTLEGCYIYNEGKFETIHAGVNTQTENGRVGPVVKAAQLLRDYKKEPVYFIVVGMGNTQLYNSGSAQVQDWHPQSNEVLLQAKQTIEKARKALAASAKEPVFKSITWWQGENDAIYQEKAEAYLENEIAFFASLEEVSYLKDAKRVVFKIFTDVESHPHAGTVNAAKAQRAANDPLTIRVIDPQAYPRNSEEDRLHADAKGQIQAGTDIFNAIRSL